MTRGTGAAGIAAPDWLAIREALTIGDVPCFLAELRRELLDRRLTVGSLHADLQSCCFSKVLARAPNARTLSNEPQASPRSAAASDGCLPRTAWTGLVSAQESPDVVLPFIVGCLEDLRAEDAAASGSPDPAANECSPTPIADGGGHGGAAGKELSGNVIAPAPAHRQTEAAQQDAQSHPEDTGAAPAPHKQAPFAGAERPVLSGRARDCVLLTIQCCRPPLHAGRCRIWPAAAFHVSPIQIRTAVGVCCQAVCFWAPSSPCRAGPLMHLLLDLIPQNLPVGGTEAVPHSLCERAAVLYGSYAADRMTYARSTLKIAQVLLAGRGSSDCISDQTSQGLCPIGPCPCF